MNAEFRERLEAFVAGAQQKINSYYETNWPNSTVNKPEKLVIEENPKYIRIVKEDRRSGGRSLYCFIDRETGRIWKGKGWASAEKKNPRGCIFDHDYGLRGVDWHGTIYLR